MKVTRTYLSVTYCETHHKLSYTSRKRARQIARRHSEHKGVYRCKDNEDLWHVGSLPDPVKYGHIPKHEFFAQVANA